MDSLTRPHIVFLFSDTGGGHRSAAQAIIEALELDYPAQTSHEMVDIFRQYAPPLLDRVPDFYPPLSRKPCLLGAIFYLSHGARRIRLFLKVLWPFVRQAVERLQREHPADAYVSVHPLINAPLGYGLELSGARTPFITVVTDLVTAHASWFWRRSNRFLVPTQAAYEQGLKFGIAPEVLRVVGLPVAERFCRPGEARENLRARLGWPQDRPLALIMGGGEGSGPLEPIAQAIDAAGLGVALAIVAGRNQKMKERLEATAWQSPTFVYGFTQEIPEFMRAADVLVTKAGPGTLSEALAARLPVLLYSRLNGPEDGNVNYVVANGAGVWAPGPGRVVAALRRWLENPEERERASAACLALARPRASHAVARVIWEEAHSQG